MNKKIEIEKKAVLNKKHYANASNVRWNKVREEKAQKMVPKIVKILDDNKFHTIKDLALHIARAIVNKKLI